MKAKDLVRPHSVAVSTILIAGVLGCDSGGNGDDGSSTGGAGGMTNGGAAPMNIQMIDDQEDGDGYFFSHEFCWEGAWFTYTDMTGGATISPAEFSAYTMTAVSPPREASAFAANTTGSGFVTWGAGTGMQLRIFPEDGASAFPGEMGECAEFVNSGPDPLPYDATARGFTGVGFWAKSGDAAATAMVSLKVPTEAVVPTTRGGMCDTALGDCDNAHEADFSVTTEWQYYSFLWGELMQENWGQKFPFDPTKIYGFQWQTGMGDTFNVWIDDVHFLTN